MTATGTEEDWAKYIGGRLREVRKRFNLSLQAVEEKSGGTWKAVVIGSYERGDRAITVRRMLALADFYGVPAASLLPGWLGEFDQQDRQEQVEQLIAAAHAIVSKAHSPVVPA